jgi:glyoxylase-like metal-dependent hydrolase (beta-lactamase superfamily II)
MAVAKIRPGVWRAGTRFVNWYVVDGGAAGLTLVDAGFPKYAAKLGETLRAIDRTPADVKAVVLTHGHIDHTGMSAALAALGATVYLHPADSALAADPRLNEPESRALPYLRYPTPWIFTAHAIRAGATKPPPMPTQTPLRDGDVLDIPGSPRVIHAPGHTAGSVVLDFPEHEVVFLGDLLCTVSFTWGRPAPPQLQTRMSNANSAQALDSLSRLEGIEAQTVLPGHGNPWQDGVEAAVESARRIGCT